MGGGAVGLVCYLGLVPFDPATLRFDGIVRRHLEIMTGAGILGRRGVLDDRRPQRRRLARAAAAARGAAARRRRRRAATARGAAGTPATLGASRRLFLRFASAKPQPMNRTGLFIALGLFAVVGLLFGIFPELDLWLAGLFFDAQSKSFPLKSVPAANFARDAAMWIAWAFAAPSIVALVVKLARPDKPLLVRGRTVTFFAGHRSRWPPAS